VNIEPWDLRIGQPDEKVFHARLFLQLADAVSMQHVDESLRLAPIQRIPQ
jgi:hypothetical protein